MFWNKWFSTVLDMTLTGSAVICGVQVLRIILSRAPRIFSYALWLAVLLRLLCPVSLSAPMGVLPEPRQERYAVAEPRAELADETEAESKTADNEVIVEIDLPHVRSAEKTAISIWRTTWPAGVGALLLWSAIQYIRLRRSLIGAIPLGGNIWQADHIDTPFVMGVLRPKIYLPSSLAKSERDYVIAHERHHIQRGDPIWRALAFAALCLHWFNPLVWLAFAHSRQDMELSCDEAVMRELGRDIRAEYSESLLKFATGKRPLVGAPLAFGESDTKERIVHVMKYKKPAIWVTVIAAVLCVSAVTVFAFNAKSGDAPRALTAREALDALEASIDWWEDDAGGSYVSFTLPENYPAENWNLHISGRAEYEDGMSMSRHFFEGEGWEAGGRYIVELLHMTNLTLVAWLPGEDGDMLAKDIDLLAHEGDAVSRGALGELAESVAWDEESVSFTLPQNIDASKWDLQINGHAFDENGQRYVEHWLWEINDNHAWEAGKTYYIPLNNVDTIHMDAYLTDRAGHQLRKTIELLPEAYSAASIARWEADLDVDGAMERIVLDVGPLEENAFSVPWIESADGTKLCELDPIGIPHLVWNTYALLEMDGRTYLFQYNPSMSTGAASYSYCIWSVDPDSGRLKLEHGKRIDFSTYAPMSDAEIDALVEFIDIVNGYWQYSRLLFTTDETVAHGLTQPDGRAYPTGVPVICGSSGGPRYVEDLPWVTEALVEAGVFDGHLGLRERLVEYKTLSEQRYEQYLETFSD